MRENIRFLVFWAWLTSLKMMFSTSIHLLALLWFLWATLLHIGVLVGSCFVSGLEIHPHICLCFPAFRVFAEGFCYSNRFIFVINLLFLSCSFQYSFFVLNSSHFKGVLNASALGCPLLSLDLRNFLLQFHQVFYVFSHFLDSFIYTTHS
jgi:hypothetical protein